MLPDLAAVVQIVREVAIEEILPRFGTLAAHQICSKNHPGDLVTDADIYAEQALSRKLMALLPGSVVVGEEACYQNQSILDRLSQDVPVWVLDPVDGTGNFIRGCKRFGVTVALVRRGQIIFGCIHDPVRNITAAGEEGGGTWSDGLRLQVPASPSLPAMCGSVGTSLVRMLEGRVARLVHYSSAAQDYLALLWGEIHFALYRRLLLPWDHAAGVLLHREAGGYGAMVKGCAYRPVMEDEGMLLLAPDQTSWQALLALVNETAKQTNGILPSSHTH
ncbi:Inositol monophosphatase and related sulfite synthesis enzyme [invertebrate metagenome]|uniref:Inositol monophosphatase and related sulfite synthesis enzyme n=1 Tax=invertebrate metagenome TaxID=1711999 RepID=A0A484H5G6_9ZZZZ